MCGIRSSGTAFAFHFGGREKLRSSSRRCPVIATRHHLPLTVQLAKWLLLMAAAAALVAALATAAAAEPMTEPARLPDGMDLLAKPMEVQPIKPYFPEEMPAVEMPPEQAAATVWMILEAQ